MPFSKEAERQREGNQKQDILDMRIQQRRPGGIKMVRDGRNVLNFVCFCNSRRAAAVALQKRAKVLQVDKAETGRDDQTKGREADEVMVTQGR